jgi:Telomere recombination
MYRSQNVTTKLQVCAERQLVHASTSGRQAHALQPQTSAPRRCRLRSVACAAVKTPTWRIKTYKGDGAHIRSGECQHVQIDPDGYDFWQLGRIADMLRDGAVRVPQVWIKDDRALLSGDESRMLLVDGNLYHTRDDARRCQQMQYRLTELRVGPGCIKNSENALKQVIVAAVHVAVAHCTVIAALAALWHAPVNQRAMQIGVIPTDSYPALVCDLENASSVQMLAAVKDVSPAKPMSILVKNFQDVDKYTLGWPPSCLPGVYR